MRNFYMEQSSNRYTVNGDVTDWVRCRSTRRATARTCAAASSAPRSGRSSNDSVGLPGQRSRPWRAAELNAYLAKFDVWDRYDYDGDGNFNEPDGYIDHFQSIHAGVGEETGGGAQGTDAIWSHRWYAYHIRTPVGLDGAGPHELRRRPRSATRNYWIGDYTIEPENGGVGVFSHEFAPRPRPARRVRHVGNTGGAENCTGCWTLMSQGSYGTQRHRRRGHRRPAGPHERVGQVPARLAQLRRRFGQATSKASSSSARPRRTRKQAQAAVRRAARQAGDRRPSATPFAGARLLLLGLGQRPRQLHDPSRSRLRPGPISLSSKVAVQDRDRTGTTPTSTFRPTADHVHRCRPASRPPATRTARTSATASRDLRCRVWTRSTPSGSVDRRPDRVRRPDRPVAVPLLDRRRGRRRRASRSTTSRSPARRRTAAETDAGWTFTPASAASATTGSSTPRTSTPTSPRTGSTSATTQSCRPVRTTSVPHSRARTGSSTSRTRTACSSGTGTRRSTTTTSATIPGGGLILPDRLASGDAALEQRRTDAAAHPVVRRALHARGDGRDHAAQRTASRRTHPVAGWRARRSTTTTATGSPATRATRRIGRTSRSGTA